MLVERSSVFLTKKISFFNYYQEKKNDLHSLRLWVAWGWSVCVCVCVCVNDGPSHWLFPLILSHSMTTSHRVMETEKQRWSSEWVYLLKTGRMNVFVFASERQKVCVWVCRPRVPVGVVAIHPFPLDQSEAENPGRVMMRLANECVCDCASGLCVCVWEKERQSSYSQHIRYFWMKGLRGTFNALS